YQFTTSLYHDGYIEDSILVGNLFVEGGGDPTLGSEFVEKNKEDFLKEWTGVLKGKGIKQISGNIIVLDQLYGYDGIPGKYLWEDLGNYYASVVTGVSVFDNFYRIVLRSFKPGAKAKILTTEPLMESMIFRNEIISGSTNSDLSYISGAPFSNKRRLGGVIPSNRSSFQIKGDIPDPGQYLATYFKSYLEQQNIFVVGKATTYRTTPLIPENQNLLAEYFSPALASIVRVVNEKSNNHYAECLYKLLTIKEKINFNAFWEEKGIDPSALFIYDGSGLSAVNAVSASFVNSILEYMYEKYGTSHAFYKSFPIVGEEGTVVAFLKNTPLEGKARVKSGSMTNVCSYSGYIEHDNQKYIFTIIVNNFRGTQTLIRTAIGDLLVSLL
ncbi:D-alanyl-D-alanine carboxypeptidase/D-alanyl-D-alanine-endopeptidase, partial [Bacteroidales bacterium OttesenSCG-928-M06]|nr:D-alanyl-D-alanine carboxypeptidase/D-alanyl-D-alanine-endopeptidase [Bacteroidales bacterium OttesenSCG-928-M06]